MYEVLSCALKPHCPESLVFRCSLHPQHVPSAVLDGRYKGTRCTSCHVDQELLISSMEGSSPGEIGL